MINPKTIGKQVNIANISLKNSFDKVIAKCYGSILPQELIGRMQDMFLKDDHHKPVPFSSNVE